MGKTRLDELYDADVDYSMPIDVFARKAKALFNKAAKGAGVKTRAYYAEYSDGAARIFLDYGRCNDSLASIGGVLSVFALNAELLATENKKLTKLELPVRSITFDGGEINVNF